MRTKLPFLLVVLFLCGNLFSQNYNITYKSKVTFPGQTLANVWGIKRNGKEYALVGASQGMVVVDVTDPVNPVVVTQFTDGINSQWREIKTYGNYAYITSEGTTTGGTGGLGIANLTNLNTPLPSGGLPFQKYHGDGAIANQLIRSHSLHVDTVKGYAYIYGMANLANGGALALNLNPDPYNPVYAGQYNTNYIHDGYAHNDTLYGAHIYAGYFSIINFTNKSSPVVLTTRTTPGAFTHNTWLTQDRQHLLTTDEISGSYLTAYSFSYNASTGQWNTTEKDRIQNAPGSGSIVHNTHVKSRYAISSWYRDGVVITDVGRPSNLIQVGRYDTYTVGSGNGFNGAWGVYPYLPSGNILVSNISETLSGGGTGGVLYILTPTYTPACYLEGNVTEQGTGANLFGVSVEIQHTDPLNTATTSLNGNYATGQPTAGTFNVVFSKSGYVSQTLSASLSAGNVTVLNVIMASQSLPLEMVSFRAKPAGDYNHLSWETARERNTLRHDIQAKYNERDHWRTIGAVPAAGHSESSRTYIFEDKTPRHKAYYRIRTLDSDGAEHFSEVVFVERPQEGFGIKNIYPVPCTGVFTVEWSSGQAGSAKAKLGDLSGQYLFETTFEHSPGLQKQDIHFPDGWPAGEYWIEISNGNFSEKAFVLLNR
jgi:choice-of-anchor B domain-containing protein